MISLKCLHPMCGRTYSETVGFSDKLPKSMQGRCPYCGSRDVVILPKEAA